MRKKNYYSTAPLSHYNLHKSVLFPDTTFTKLTKLELFFIKKKFLLLASSTLNFKRGEEENGLNTVQSTQGCQDAELAKCQVYDLP